MIGFPAENALATQMRERLVQEHPVLAAHSDREQLMAAAWLAGFRSVRTRRAYAADLSEWLRWLSTHQLDLVAATRVVADVWGPGSARCRRSALLGLPTIVGPVIVLCAPVAPRPDRG